MRRRAAVLAALLLALLPAAARSDFGLVPGSLQVSVLDAAGQPQLGAGAHPDKLLTAFELTTLPGGGVDGNVKDVAIDLPTGLVGAPRAIPSCPRGAFAQGACRPEALVGVMRATFAGLGRLDFPIYNVVPRAGGLAEFGVLSLVPVRLVTVLRPDDYGTRIQLQDMPQNTPLSKVEVELWGVPADHQPGDPAVRRPLLTNPADCDGEPMTTTVRVRSWQRPDRWLADSTRASGPLTGCELLPFAPSLELALETYTTDTPSGMSVVVTLPQHDDPDGRATSQVRGLSAALPGGLTLSPGLADGLGACDDAQFALDSPAPPSCPPSAKIGSLELTTPLLAEPVQGAIHLARPTPSDPFRLFLAGSASGIDLKLVGSLRPDSASGRLSVTLDGLPPIPFSRLELRFKGGPRAPIATPVRCGAAAATADVTPSRGGPPARLASVIEISDGPGGRLCPRVAPFAPQFTAGSSPALAGRGTTFSMAASRPDGQQLLGGLTVTLPAGLSAQLGSVRPCPMPTAMLAGCTRDSRIGSVAVEAGAGPSPLPLTGDAYLTGPHEGAPFGVALVLRASAGPLDLGTVIVPGALRVDPRDARVTIHAGPIPSLLGGIPLRLRTLALDVDRPGFMQAPTACRPQRIAASFTSLDAATSAAVVPYAIGGCGRLRFAPRVALSLRSHDRGELRRADRPSLTIALRPRPGHAAIRTASVRLPEVLSLDPSAVGQVCPRSRARAGTCPRTSSVGGARVRTALLPQPLTGSVDVVQPRRGGNPELWATVAAMGVRLTLRSTTSAQPGKPIRARFAGLPDVPLTSFALTLRGGRGGVLRLERGLCAGGSARRLAGSASLQGHNGASQTARVRVGVGAAC